MTTAPSIEVVLKAVEQSLSPNNAVQLNQSFTQIEDKRSTIHLFDRILQQKHLFTNRELLSPSYIPEVLPHREKEINELAQILSPVLDLQAPSNVLVFGKPGTGKTATTKFVGGELQAHGKAQGKRIYVLHINCELCNSLYKILQHLGQQLINNPQDIIPLSGLSVDTLFAKITTRIDTCKQIIILVLDEADKICDDALYTLTRINEQFRQARLSLICISNNLKFVELQDARIRSSLGEQNIIFNPYDASELQDILRSRSEQALQPNILANDVIPLCSALAAQEHGDARRALDLLRVSVELAERNNDHLVSGKYVRLAQNKIEKDRIAEVISNLPVQERLVLHAINRLQRYNERMKKVGPIITGEIFSQYRELAKAAHYTPLTQRRVTDFISELDCLGVITARVISKGRYGRTREIVIAVSSTELACILQKDEFLNEIEHVKMKNQVKLL